MAFSYDLKDEKQAKEYLEKVGIEYRFQCYHEKLPEGCHRLADYQANIHQDFVKAGNVYKLNCDENKYGHSCFKYGNHRFSGKGGPKNCKEALQYYVRGCDHGYGPSCQNAGLLYRRGSAPEVTKDHEKAVEYLKKACDNDMTDSCFQLSGYFINGCDSITRDMSTAHKYSVKSCNLGNPMACGNVSLMYKKGDGVAKDTKLSEAFKLKGQALIQAIETAKKEQTITFSQ